MRRAHGITLLTVPLLLASSAPAQLNADRTLHGLDALGVVVADVHPDAERRGLSRSALQTAVETRLRQAGIRVLTEEDGAETPEPPLLYLHVGIAPLESFPVYSVTIELQLRQSVCLARNLILCDTAITWEDESAGRAVSVSRLASLQQEVRDMVDRFATAYLSENAKP
jgi:hypothetical protein